MTPSKKSSFEKAFSDPFGPAKSLLDSSWLLDSNWINKLSQGPLVDKKILHVIDWAISINKAICESDYTAEAKDKRDSARAMVELELLKYRLTEKELKKKKKEVNNNS